MFAEKARLDLYTPITTELAPILGENVGSILNRINASINSPDNNVSTNGYYKKKLYDEFDLPNVCTDGVATGWGYDPYHLDDTSESKSGEYANPFQIRYAVRPGDYSGTAQKGDIAILLDLITQKYVITIIAEVGPPLQKPDGTKGSGSYTEFSVGAVWDLLQRDPPNINGSAINAKYKETNRYAVIYLPGTKDDYMYSALNTWALISDNFQWSPRVHQDFGFESRTNKPPNWY